MSPNSNTIHIQMQSSVAPIAKYGISLSPLHSDMTHCVFTTTDPDRSKQQIIWLH